MNFPSMYEKLFYKALRIRMVEERITALYPSDKIQSPVHLSIGQEAIAAGACESLRKTDLVFCTYRSHAFYLAKGGDMKQMFAELYGKSTGCCGGKGGSMHLAAPEVGLMGIGSRWQHYPACGGRCARLPVFAERPGHCGGLWRRRHGRRRIPRIAELCRPAPSTTDFSGGKQLPCGPLARFLTTRLRHHGARLRVRNSRDQS